MEKQARSQTINNAFYDELGLDWYESLDHPIALLRAENAVRVPWILSEIGDAKTVLDIGCGAGFLTNALALKGHKTYGIDFSEKSLSIAAEKDATKKVNYIQASATKLPFSDHFFDEVCAMDLLEHVESPSLVIKEASRVLKPGGRFFFHTFNRNFLSYLLIIKGVDWFVPNAPKNMHVYSLFIKPKELKAMLLENHLKTLCMKGFQPKILSRPFLNMIFKKKISENLPFRFSKSLLTGYSGFAKKI